MGKIKNTGNRNYIGKYKGNLIIFWVCKSSPFYKRKNA